MCGTSNSRHPVSLHFIYHLSSQFVNGCHIAPYVNHHLLNTMNSIFEIKKCFIYKLMGTRYRIRGEQPISEIHCEPKTPLVYKNQESERMSHCTLWQHDSWFIWPARLCRLVTLFLLEPKSATTGMSSDLHLVSYCISGNKMKLQITRISETLVNLLHKYYLTFQIVVNSLNAFISVFSLQIEPTNHSYLDI